MRLGPNSICSNQSISTALIFIGLHLTKGRLTVNNVFRISSTNTDWICKRSENSPRFVHIPELNANLRTF